MTTSGAGPTFLALLGLNPETRRLDVAGDGPLIEWNGLVDDVWTVDDDRSFALISYGLTYGRQDARGKVTPAVVTVRGASGLAGSPVTGDRFRLAICDAAAAVLGLTVDEAARFTGEVTDVELDPESGTWTVVGVGTLPRQARRTIDLRFTGPASASDRWSAIVAAIGATPDDVETTPAILAAVDAIMPGSQLLDVVADSTLGQTVQDLDGGINWRDPDHRRGASPVISLDAGEILSSIRWAQHVGSVVNIATVNYVGGTVVVTDHASVTARGEYPVTVSTALTTRSDARSLGQLLVGRFAVPAWDLPTLIVDPARTVGLGHLSDLLTLRHADRLTLTDLPAGGPVEGDADFYAEGFSEQASRFSWRIGLAVSDPTLSGVSIRWIDVTAESVIPVTVDGGDSTATGPFDLTVDGGDSSTSGGADLTWENVYPDVRWFDVARMESADELGPFTGHTYNGGTSAA